MSVQSAEPGLAVGRAPAGERTLAVAPATIALAAITALAAALRFQGLSGMRLNPYYDAAVRSMGTSWHALLVGAFNPNASIATDKPPLDLWLQVASTKLFGFTHFALLLPEALASTAAVVLLYDLVRRGFGRTAGLAAAAALAVLPVDVMMARSDSMDGVMIALLVLAAWLVVRAIERERVLELLAAGAVVGLAFETKLFEALVPLPALMLLYLVGSRQRWGRRLGELASAGLVMVGVGLAWPALFALLARGGKPYPLGSSNGSIWNTIFVYNGIGRLTSQSTRTASDLLSPPGPLRLFSSSAFHFNLLVGLILVAAISFAAAALALGLVRRSEMGPLPFALAVAMGTWLIVGAAVLSSMRHLPSRYLETVAPAAAAVLGIGVVCVARRARTSLPARLALVAALVASVLYARAQVGLPPAAFAGALAALGLLAAARLFVRRAVPLTAALAAAVLVALLAAPLSQSLTLVRHRVAGGGALGSMPSSTIDPLSAYLMRHRGHSRFEFAATSAALAAPLIVADHQPALVLAGTPYHQLVGPGQLRRAARAGEVRYVVVSPTPTNHPIHPFSARTPRGALPAWVVSHGTDVTRQAGINGYGVLYRI
ncbi:MAG TPA: glycosyltransferase family 39 protein [Thermoleophilaceae bacterium]